MLSSEELDLARKVIRSAKADPLGLGSDPESALAVADAAANQFFREQLSPEALDAWREIVAEVQSREHLPESVREELQTHAHLISVFQACMAEGAGARLQDIVLQKLSALSLDIALQVAAKMTSLAVGIAQTMGRSEIRAAGG